MTIISFETSSNKSTGDKKKNTFHSTKRGYIILGQNAITQKKKEKRKDPISRSSPVGDPSGSQLSQTGDPWPETSTPYPWPKKPHP